MIDGMKNYAILLFASVLCAQQPPPQQAEPGMTRSQAETIINELRAIRELLEKGALNGAAKPAQETPARVKITLEGGEWLGRKTRRLRSSNMRTTSVLFAGYITGTLTSRSSRPSWTAGRFDTPLAICRSISIPMR
jgi:hypothetical protein